VVVERGNVEVACGWKFANLKTPFSKEGVPLTVNQ